MKIIDARGMHPPEPFELVIAALAELPLGEELKFVAHHEPQPLYRFLERNRYTYATTKIAEGHFEVLIRELPGGVAAEKS